MKQQEKQFNINFILPNDGSLAAALIIGTTFNDIIDEIKTMEDGLNPNINNEDFKITNLSEGRKFERVKLTNKVEQLGTGELKVKFQQPSQMKEEIFITFTYQGVQIPVAAQKETQLSEIIQSFKENQGIQPSINLIPMIAGEQIHDASVEVINKRYKNKLIELVKKTKQSSENIKETSPPKPVTPPKKKITIVITVVDGQRKEELTLIERGLNQSYSTIKKQVDLYATKRFDYWSEKEPVKLYNDGKIFDQNKPFNLLKSDSYKIYITVQRQFPGGC